MCIFAESSNGDGVGESMSSERTGFLTGWADNELYYRYRSAGGGAAGDQVKGVVLIVHGYAEHGGRYEHFTKALSDDGWCSYAFDWRGHGNSEGFRAFVLRFDHLVRDLRVIVDFVHSREKDLPVFLFGHSAGAAVCLRFAERSNERVAGVITSSAYLRSRNPENPWLKAAARVIDFLVPMLAVVPFDTTGLSRDREVIAEYRSDSLVYNGKIRVRTGLELVSAGKRVLRDAGKITLSVYILHGGADPIADPKASREIFEMISSEDKQHREYEGHYHELLNEPEADVVISDILSWLDQHSAPRGSR